MIRGLWFDDVGTGPPVLMVHGGGTHGPLWATDLRPLTDMCRLIIPTRRGYPGSPPSPEDWTAHTDDMIELLDSLELDSVAVVAHSAGCIVALDLALSHDDRVERLVLLDPAVRLRSFITTAFLRAFLTAQVVRRVRGDEAAIEGWFRYVMSYRAGGTAWDKLPTSRREALRTNAAGVFADFRSGDGSAQVDDERLQRLSLPVTVVLADQSPASLRRSGEHLAQLIPRAERFVITNSGHALAFDQPKELLALLRATLSTATELP